MKVYLLWEEQRDGRSFLGPFSTPELAQAHRPGEWQTVEGAAETWRRPAGRRSRARAFWIEVDLLDRPRSN